MQKLVRDKIPEIIRLNGEKPDIRILGKREFRVALKQKLIEEAGELAQAHSKAELIEELADVQEVLRAFYVAYGIDCGDVTKVARKKRKQRGGFTKRVFLESVQ